MSPRTPAPDTMPLARALDRSEPLALLLRRVRASQAHFDAIADLLPGTLRADLRPGPLDDLNWTLLAANGAAAAKTRQLLPLILQAVTGRGWQGTSIKVRVQPRNVAGG